MVGESARTVYPQQIRRGTASAVVRSVWVWVAFVITMLLSMDLVTLWWLGIIAPAGAAAVALFQRVSPPPGVAWFRGGADRRDLVAVGVLYSLVVALFSAAFLWFGTDRVVGLFLTFAAGMLVGVLGPVGYMVWGRDRSLVDLGIGGHRLRETAALGVVLAAVQFSMTLWGYDLPAAEDWVPLLVMSLVVGAFEAVFFRGFVQGRLEESFGTAPAVAGAALLYSLYHVGYGMGASEMVFLFGLGVIYAVAYRLVRNVLVLWPLLTPLGAFFNNLEAGDIDLPWASIAGFADVAALMAVGIWLAHRHEVRRTRGAAGPPAMGPNARAAAAHARPSGDGAPRVRGPVINASRMGGRQRTRRPS